MSDDEDTERYQKEYDETAKTYSWIKPSNWRGEDSEEENQDEEEKTEEE